jgi:Na+/proline symporter
MASAFVNDFYREIRPGLDEAKYVAIGRKATVVWGVILGAYRRLSA